MIIAAVPTLFLIKQPSLGAGGYTTQGMDAITNKKVNVYLDKEIGALNVADLLENTMVFLYDSLGELIGKYHYVSPSITLMIPRQGTYVLVMSHPNCQPEVRRIIY